MDIAKIRREQPWIVKEWCEAIGLPEAVASTVTQHLCTVGPQVAILSEAEQGFYAYTERRELAKLVPDSTAVYRRAQDAIERGKGTVFGDALAASPMAKDAKLCAWLGEHAKASLATPRKVVS